MTYHILDPLGVEIVLVKAACVRFRAALDAQAEEARGACCPDCMFGSARRTIVDKFGRTSKWLTILLRKRGERGDEALARAIDCGAWP